MYVMFKWNTWLDAQKENASVFRYFYDMAGAKALCLWLLFLLCHVSAKNEPKIVHHNLNSTVTPFPRVDNLRVPEPPENGLAFLA